MKSICVPVCLKHFVGLTINMNILPTLKTGNKSIETNFMHMRVINGLTTVNAPQRTLTSMRCAENDPILKTAKIQISWLLKRSQLIWINTISQSVCGSSVTGLMQVNKLEIRKVCYMLINTAVQWFKSKAQTSIYACTGILCTD